MTDKRKIYEYTVENFHGRIDSYLHYCQSYSSRVIKSVKKEGELFLNGKSALFIDECSEGDKLKILLRPEAYDAEPENIPLDILYEDADILVVNKPPFMVTHPTKSHQSGTLANAVYFHYKENAYFGKLHFVSRLDMDTSGVVLIAKNKYVHHVMQNISELRPFDKHYTAIVKGEPPTKHGVIDAPIMRSGEGIKRVVDENGRECKTEYTLIEKLSGYSLLELKLLTGRTHQIRVHLSYIGCPIISDWLYGEADENINRQALHAKEVSICHPVTKQLMIFHADMPKDMSDALEKIRKRKN